MTGYERLLDHRVIHDDGCWTWTRKPRPDGYADIRVEGRMLYVHRVAYEATYGPIPQGLEIDHLCRNRPCFNPEHLEAVTPRENQRRSMSFAGVNARKTHCKHGHPFTLDNVRIDRGSRTCKACRRILRAKIYAETGK